MHLAWATDIHLNFLSRRERQRFLESINGQADALVVTGDIAESNSLGEILRQIRDTLTMPIYFVLGNHDFYRGSIADTRAAVAKMIRGSDKLTYLNQAGAVELTPNTCLVGHDGWADGRLGDLDGTDVILNDFLLIDELRHWRDRHALDKPVLRTILQKLGDAAAEYLDRLATLRPGHVSAWRDELQRQGLSNATVRRKLTAIRSLFSYLQIYGYTGENPDHGKFIAAPAASRDGKTVGLSPRACRQLLEARSADTPAGIRDRAILGVLAYSACRVGELVRLTVGDFKTSGEHRVLCIHGKGGKERIVPLHLEAV